MLCSFKVPGGALLYKMLRLRRCFMNTAISSQNMGVWETGNFCGVSSLNIISLPLFRLGHAYRRTVIVNTS
jgi:hypothetical protein